MSDPDEHKDLAERILVISFIKYIQKDVRFHLCNE